MAAAAWTSKRPLDAQRHGGQGRLVEDAIDAFDRCGDGRGVEDVALEELDAVAEAVQVREPARAEVVEDADAIAAGHQCLGDVGADEAGAAGNEEGSHGIKAGFAAAGFNRQMNRPPEGDS